jgi:hypothetical protein
MPGYNHKHKTVLDELLLNHPFIRPGVMFGYPAYYVGKKLCICLYEEGVGVKVPALTAARLLETDHNIIPFQPMGKAKMREWVQINVGRSEEYRQYMPIFEESIAYLRSQAEQTK